MFFGMRKKNGDEKQADNKTKSNNKTKQQTRCSLILSMGIIEPDDLPKNFPLHYRKTLLIDSSAIIFHNIVWEKRVYQAISS